ncbi:hypothetical protein TEA_019910 [Camellia sinensis var. sinensis]|uniref:Uncharacterized protein n=1 Tax=Camellia sinensis var. sinensis TaxID=542762 RepID=A0A4S4F0Y5_CAMSN|nr:hypothetical protein TEA_019910 [Camellia sinensis var. sinensis]
MYDTYTQNKPNVRSPSQIPNRSSSYQLTIAHRSSSLSSTVITIPHWLSATKEVKMTSMVDDINAYSYLYPAELPSRKFVFKWLLELLVNALPLLIGNEDKLIWEADLSGHQANRAQHETAGSPSKHLGGTKASGGQNRATAHEIRPGKLKTALAGTNAIGGPKIVKQAEKARETSITRKHRVVMAIERVIAQVIEQGRTEKLRLFTYRMTMIMGLTTGKERN